MSCFLHGFTGCQLVKHQAVIGYKSSEHHVIMLVTAFFRGQFDLITANNL
jgi:hypothetical protein